MALSVSDSRAIRCLHLTDSDWDADFQQLLIIVVMHYLRPPQFNPQAPRVTEATTTGHERRRSETRSMPRYISQLFHKFNIALFSRKIRVSGIAGDLHCLRYQLIVLLHSCGIVNNVFIDLALI